MPESPAEALRHAAEKMRGLANAATEGPWSTGRSGLSVWVESASGDLFVADVGDQGNEFAEADGAFIAAVHPGVALLIADQWDAVADLAAISLKHWDGDVLTHASQPTAIETTALAAARAFLGEAVELGDDEDGYETDPDPKPRDGEHGTCVFGCAIRYFERDGLSWWAHETEPADGHDAEIGGPS